MFTVKTRTAWPCRSRPYDPSTRRFLCADRHDVTSQKIQRHLLQLTSRCFACTGQIMDSEISCITLWKHRLGERSSRLKEQSSIRFLEVWYTACGKRSCETKRPNICHNCNILTEAPGFRRTWFGKRCCSQTYFQTIYTAEVSIVGLVTRLCAGQSGVRNLVGTINFSILYWVLLNHLFKGYRGLFPRRKATRSWG
jgi:hypothetical protein